MTRKLFIVTLSIMLTLSACSGRGATPTATPAVTDTQPAQPVVATTAAVMTETPTAQANGTAVTETAGTPGIAAGPTNPPDCTNSASFVEDVTIPDNTSVAAGTIFTKTWRVANKGTCTWGPDYKLTYYSDERMGAPETVALSVTAPGQTTDITVNLTAPTSPGRHQANFVIKSPAGLIMKVDADSRLWVVINVVVGGDAAALATPTTGGAATAANTLPPATLAAATLPAATRPAATLPPATLPAATMSGSIPSCLYSSDRTKLMEVINAVNAYRAGKGLPAYTVDPRLAQAAQIHAGDMACNRLSTGTGSDGSTPQSRVAATGYTASSVSENVQNGNPPLAGQAVVNFWSGDPNNNQNLLSTTFTEIGVGYAFFNNTGYYVIVFARP